MTTTNTNQQERIIKELEALHVGGWAATLGLPQGFKCAYCDKDLLASYDAYRSFELDHIIPKNGEGENTEENQVVCCRCCNLLKGTYPPAGNSREERIADARRYVQQQRAPKEAEVAKIRLLVHGGSLTNAQPGA